MNSTPSSEPSLPTASPRTQLELAARAAEPRGRAPRHSPSFLGPLGRCALVALLGAFLLLGAPRPAASEKPDTWYALTITEDEQSFRMTHLWSSGRKFRSETVVAGHPIVTIVSGGTYYTLDLATAKGVAIGRSETALRADARGGRPFANDLRTLLATGGEKIGPDEEGRECDRYRRTNDAGRVTMCMSRSEEQVPLYIEIYDRATTHKERARYLDWQRAFPIADSFFEPPADIELERIEYEAYRKRSKFKPFGPVPPLFSDLLHGTPE